MYLETVDSAISNPSFSSSLWMRGAVDGVHLEQPLILLYKRVPRFREDALKRWLVKVLKGGHHRLSFPNIMSARNDDVFRTEPVWRRRSRIARRLYPHSPDPIFESLPVGTIIVAHQIARRFPWLDIRQRHSD